MQVKDLIAVLQQADPEAMVVTISNNHLNADNIGVAITTMGQRRTGCVLIGNYYSGNFKPATYKGKWVPGNDPVLIRDLTTNNPITPTQVIEQYSVGGRGFRSLDEVDQYA